jgi:hypothetical protein
MRVVRLCPERKARVRIGLIANEKNVARMRTQEISCPRQVKNHELGLAPMDGKPLAKKQKNTIQRKCRM